MPRKMTKTYVRHAAQDKMLSVLWGMFKQRNPTSPLQLELQKQFTRIEEMFGYEKGSFEPAPQLPLEPSKKDKK